MTPPIERLRVLLEDVGDQPQVMVATALLRAIVATDSRSIEQNATLSLDLTCEQVGAALGRDSSLIRAWCRSGLFPDAYKLHRREWRIPPAAVAAFQRNQQANYQNAA